MFEAFSAVLQKKEKKNWKLNPVNDICQKNYENSHIWTLLFFSFTWMKFYDGKETTWFNLTLEFILIILTYIYTRTWFFVLDSITILYSWEMIGVHVCEGENNTQTRCG